VSLTQLVDTTVLTRLRHVAVRAVVEPMAAAGSVGRAGITDLEIGDSARSAKEWGQAIDALDAFDLIETSADHVRRALQVQRLLASKHQRGGQLSPPLRCGKARGEVVGDVRSDGPSCPARWDLGGSARILAGSRRPA
jgi:predicted nucleic acid-binding protein